MPERDPPVSVHHLRLGVNTPELREALLGLKGWAIVSHEGGKEGEHPHLHCYIQHSEPITAMTVKNRLKKHAPQIFGDFKGNGSWSFRPHNSLETWWEYVWRDPYLTKRPALVMWSLESEQLPIPENQNLVLESPGNIIAMGPLRKTLQTVQVVKEKKKTTQEKQQKFLRYVRDLIEIDGTNPNEMEAQDILELLYSYCRDNGFTTEACCFTYVHYVMANIHTGDKFKESQRRFAVRLANKYF